MTTNGFSNKLNPHQPIVVERIHYLKCLVDMIVSAISVLYIAAAGQIFDLLDLRASQAFRIALVAIIIEGE
jgi:hypothetical protein